MRPDDKRRLPHTPEHRASIRRGIAHSQWSHRQSKLAKDDLPHELVPMTERAVKAFDHPPLMRDRPAVAGECHWCYFYGKTIEHIKVNP